MPEVEKKSVEDICTSTAVRTGNFKTGAQELVGPKPTVRGEGRGAGQSNRTGTKRKKVRAAKLDLRKLVIRSSRVNPKTK